MCAYACERGFLQRISECGIGCRSLHPTVLSLGSEGLVSKPYDCEVCGGLQAVKGGVEI